MGAIQGLPGICHTLLRKLTPCIHVYAIEYACTGLKGLRHSRVDLLYASGPQISTSLMRKSFWLLLKFLRGCGCGHAPLASEVP